MLQFAITKMNGHPALVTDLRETLGHDDNRDAQDVVLDRLNDMGFRTNPARRLVQLETGVVEFDSVASYFVAGTEDGNEPLEELKVLLRAFAEEDEEVPA